MKKIAVLLITFVMLIAVTGCTVTVNGQEVFSKNWSPVGNEVEKSEVKEETVDSQTKINVKNSSGKIEFKPSTNDVLKVEITKKLRSSGDEGKAQELLDEMQVEVSKNSSSIDITAKYLNGIFSVRSQSIDIVISVPAKLTDVSGNLSSGNISMTGFNALKRFSLQASSGNINVFDTNAESYEIGITSGNIKAENIKGKGVVKTSSGNINMDNILGNADIRGTSGNINIDGIEGEMNAELSSGSIVVNNAYLKASSSLNSTSGRIEVKARKLDDNGSYRFGASSGNIRLYLPENSNFRLNAKASSGSIHSDFDVVGSLKDSNFRNREISGTVGSGGPTIDMNVTSGNVSIYKLK